MKNAFSDPVVEKMAVVGAVLMPHAPILVPAVGGERSGAVEASCRAMRAAATTVTGLDPQTVVVISPHSPRKPGAFGFWTGDHVQGSFAQFNAPHTRVNLPNDPHLINAIVAAAQSAGLKTWMIHHGSHSLDHGALVPLWFLTDAGWAGPTVVISLNYPDEDGLTALGGAIADAAKALHRRVVVVASGDMSHRLTPDAPCGFHPQAHRFDETFIRLVRAGDYHELEKINAELRELAAEDAVDSTLVAAAATGWNATGHEVLNYEGPFGVGYGVAILFTQKTDDRTAKAASATRENSGGDILPGLARRAVVAALHNSDELPTPAAGDYLNTPRGVFVTLRQRNGELRGCIGTITPACENLVAETWRNACLAAFEDNRFPPVTSGELAGLRFHVSVLHSAEDVASADELDPGRYGVIVSTPDGRRGLLLPGIESIQTVEEQLRFARMKGGIRPAERVQIRRFQVDHFEEPA